MTVALFAPCYVDQFYPAAARATLELLERHGCTVHVPAGAACCGQPMANAGFESESHGAMDRFVETFGGYEAVVVPSGSCTLHLREHGPAGTPPVYELCEFLTGVLGVERVAARFPHRVGVHESCHGLRGLRLGHASELAGAGESTVRRLLAGVDGIELVDLARRDECCGFGGLFAVTQEAVSVRMGADRVADHLAHGAEVVTSADLSCLMHMEGLIRRNRLPLRVLHVAEILNAQP
jgi:L-lactate dehydrogenase complex protein LldE